MKKYPGRRKAFLRSCFLAAAIVGAGSAISAEPGKNPAPGPETTSQLEGWGFGAGLSITFSKSGKRIEDAQVINGTVRVTQDRSVLSRVMLETHYLSRLLTKPMGDRCLDSSGAIKECGLGFFMAVQPGTTHTIEAIGGGLMYGHRRKPGAPATDTSAFNFGIGFVVDPYAKTLGDGIHKDQPLPAGETVVRFKERPIWSGLLFASFSF